MGKKNSFFLMLKNEAGKLYFRMDEYTCFPDESWQDAGEGIVTDIEIVSQGQDAKAGKWAKVIGKVAETEEINWEEVDCFDILDIYDVFVIAGCTFVAFLEEEQVKKYAYIKGQGLQEVSLSHVHWSHGKKEEQTAIYRKLVKQVAEQYKVADKESMQEICIRNFAKLQLDCASTIEIYENAFFFVTYPGWYRDSCKVFVVREDGTLRDTYLARFASEVTSSADTVSITLNDLQLVMDKYGISAGGDSGHAVEGVSPEERKLLTTYQLPNGAILVMFKASEFQFQSEVHKRLESKVASGLCFWMQRLGERNEFYSWID